MSDTAKTPLKLQAFPKQKLKDLPKDQDIEVTLVPKQVIEFQGISPSETHPKLTVMVDASSRSKLHYTPSNCLTGTDACFEAPGLNEMWIPQAQNPSSQFSITGFSTPHSFRIPGTLFDPTNPMRIIMAEAPRNPILMDFPSKDGSFSAGYVPDGMDDFYIAMPDETRVLDRGFIKEGAYNIEDLSDLQKTMLRSLVKEVVAAGGGFYDESELLRDFGTKGKFYLKLQGGKTYVVFKGYAGLRRFFKGTRYSLEKSYTRFSILSVAKGPMAAVKEGIPRLTKGTMVGMLFMGIVNTWTWLEQDEGPKFISDLLIEIGSDLVKGLAAGFAAAFLMGAAALIMGPLVPVYLIVAGVIIVGMVIGLGLDFIDEKIGATDSVKKVGRKVETGVKDLWAEYIEKPIADFTSRCEWEIRNMYGVP